VEALPEKVYLSRDSSRSIHESEHIFMQPGLTTTTPITTTTTTIKVREERIKFDRPQPKRLYMIEITERKDVLEIFMKENIYINKSFVPFQPLDL
jgi:hypothetical protein